MENAVDHANSVKSAKPWMNRARSSLPCEIIDLEIFLRPFFGEIAAIREYPSVRAARWERDGYTFTGDSR